MGEGECIIMGMRREKKKASCLLDCGLLIVGRRTQVADGDSELLCFGREQEKSWFGVHGWIYVEATDEVLVGMNE